MVEIQSLVQIQLPPGIVLGGKVRQTLVVDIDLLDDAKEGKVLGDRVGVLRRDGVQFPGLLATQTSPGPSHDERHGTGAAPGGDLRRQHVLGGHLVAHAGGGEGRDGIRPERYGPKRRGEKVVRRQGRGDGRRGTDRAGCAHG